MTSNDFIETKQRFHAFWNREKTDRCCIAITAPKDDALWKEYKQPSLHDLWLNTDCRISQFEEYAENTTYFGEALKIFFPNFGPGALAAFAGSEYELDSGTVWFDRKPMINNLGKIKPLELHINSLLWKTLIDLSKIAENKGIMFAHTDLDGTLDIAASFRGTENILIDLIESPDEIKKLCEYSDKFWIEIFKEISETIGKFQDGFTSWLSLWNDEPWYPNSEKQANELLDLSFECCRKSPDYF